MPFGLINAPAAFQRLMQQILSALHQDGSPNFVAVYLDDILIFSETFADHKNHIKQVLQKLEEVNLKLNPKKCQLLESLSCVPREVYPCVPRQSSTLSLLSHTRMNK